jgi:hypothetical protein
MTLTGKNFCKKCSLVKHRCEVCNSRNDLFYEYEITVGGKCKTCGVWAHCKCLLDKHECVDSL